MSLGFSLFLPLDEWSSGDGGFVLQTLSKLVRELKMLVDECIQILISDPLLLHLVLDIVIVLDHLLALPPEFLDKLVDVVGSSLDIHLLFPLLLDD